MDEITAPVDQVTAPMERKLFSYNGRDYIYDFNIITFEQAQLATEVMQFKKQTLDKPPKSLTELIRSGSAEYLARVFAYIIVRVEPDGSLEKFNRVRGYDAALAFVQGLPVSMWQTVEECITDFFGRMGKESLASTVLSHESDLDVSAIVSSMLAGAFANAKKSDDDSSNDNSATDDSTSPASSTVDSGSH